MNKPVMSLQPSEIALLSAASRIYAAYLDSGHVTEANGENMLDRSVAEALKLAKRIEEAVQADTELG